MTLDSFKRQNLDIQPYQGHLNIEFISSCLGIINHWITQIIITVDHIIKLQLVM